MIDWFCLGVGVAIAPRDCLAVDRLVEGNAEFRMGEGLIFRGFRPEMLRVVQFDSFAEGPIEVVDRGQRTR